MMTMTAINTANAVTAARYKLRDEGLRLGVTYVAPSGRLCTLCPRSPQGPNAGVATLLYTAADGTPAHSSTQDGFTLSRFNWYLLRAAR